MRVVFRLRDVGGVHIASLGASSSVSQPFTAVAMFAVPVGVVGAVERDIHAALSHRRVNASREFFRYTSEADLRDLIAVERITVERHTKSIVANQNQRASAAGRAA